MFILGIDDHGLKQKISNKRLEKQNWEHFYIESSTSIKNKHENHRKSLPNTWLDLSISITQNTFNTSLLTSVSDGLRTAYDVRGGLSWKLFQS